jgi:hypothetical protein
MPRQRCSGRSSTRLESNNVPGLSTKTAFRARILELVNSRVITRFFNNPAATSAETFFTSAPNNLA